jgi:RimJ/RimL family protein N-acetyltransferase
MANFEVTVPVLETERLRLRGFTEDDSEPLFALMQDPDVVRYIGDRRIPTRQEVWRGIAGYIGHWALRGHGLWAVDDRETGELVGRIGILNPLEWPGPEIAYTIGRRWWGQGLATEGARAGRDWGFEHLDVDELISLIDPANVASIAVATRLGERLKGETELWGNRVLVYAIGRDDWSASERGGPVARQ